jgi:hypothetical protein
VARLNSTSVIQKWLTIVSEYWHQLRKQSARQADGLRVFFGILTTAAGFLLLLKGFINGVFEPSSIVLGLGGALVCAGGGYTQLGLAVVAGGAFGCGEGALCAAALLFLAAFFTGRDNLAILGLRYFPFLAGVLALLGGEWGVAESILMMATGAGVALSARWREVVFNLTPNIIPLFCLIAPVGVSPLFLAATAKSWGPIGDLAEMPKKAATNRRERVLEFLVSPVGDWRLRVVMAGIGWALYQNWLEASGGKSLLDYAIRTWPSCSAVLGILGIASICLGCRPWLLAAIAGAGFWNFGAAWMGWDGGALLVRDEYLVWFAFPCLILVLSFLRRAKIVRDFVEIVRTCCLIFLSGTIGFSVLAKLNHDFFDTVVSCSTQGSGMALAPIYFGESWWRPLVTILGDGAVLVFAFFFAPFSTMAAAGFAYGGVGELASKATIIALTFGLYRSSDLIFIRRRWRLIVTIVGGFLLLGIPSAQVVHASTGAWFQFAVFQVISVLFFSTAGVVAAGRIDLMRRRDHGGSGWRRMQIFRRVARGGFWKVRQWGAAIPLALTAGVLILNGMAPYIGLKFNGSWASYSNLRVDHERWNHFFIPRGILLRKYDPYVKVIGTLEGNSDAKNPGDNLRPGEMYLPKLFLRAAAARSEMGLRTHLRVKWKSAEGVLDSQDEANWRSFLEGLPRDNTWGNRRWQGVLDLGQQAQTCVR